MLTHTRDDLTTVGVGRVSRTVVSLTLGPRGTPRGFAKPLLDALGQSATYFKDETSVVPRHGRALLSCSCPSNLPIPMRRCDDHHHDQGMMMLCALCSVVVYVSSVLGVYT